MWGKCTIDISSTQKVWTKKVKNIVIVGGGTAGWITSLYAKKIYPDCNIVLVESEEFGILGAGEGSTQSLTQVLEIIDISIVDLIKECSVGIKNGINFSNWSSLSSSYVHPLASNHPASNDYNFYLEVGVESDTSFAHMLAAQNNHSLSDYSFIQRISDKNKVPFISEDVNEGMTFSSNKIAQVGLHFDANMIAKYLRRIGESRGIIRKEGVVEDIIADDDGYIVELKTKKESIPVNFVFDCTGFKRLIIGNFYKSKWKSHSESLPADSAMSFFLPRTKDIPPATQSIAMDYGWMWQIPLQHRYGCGYVFDSNFISGDDAKAEIEKTLGIEVDISKTFKFNAGYYEEIWIKNCLAVGLSTGFIEPLEATSIWQTTRNLLYFFSSYNNIQTKNEKIKEKFNKRFCLDTEEIVNFLYLHYVTDKKNTNFWQDFTKNNKMPEFVDYILSVIKERPIDINHDFFDKMFMFSGTSYYYILIGNNLLTKEVLKEHALFLKNDKMDQYFGIINNQNLILDNLIDHNRFLSILRKEDI